MTNKRNGTLYIGVTSDLVSRVYQHKNRMVEGFTNSYNLELLVYFEIHESAELAIQREKQMKEWKRKWKVDLIGRKNPYWNDLYPDIVS